MNKLIKLYNKSGVILGSLRMVNRGINNVLNHVYTFLIKKAGADIGKGSIIQFGVLVEKPKLVKIGANCVLVKGSAITSEISNGKLVMGNNVQINKNVLLDHSGNLFIEDGVLISEGTIIYTHTHGYNPRDIPTPSELTIGSKVWIGTRSIVLPNVGLIGKDSIIGAGSVLSKETPTQAIMVGNSAKLIKKRHID